MALVYLDLTLCSSDILNKRFVKSSLENSLDLYDIKQIAAKVNKGSFKINSFGEREGCCGLLLLVSF